MLQPCPCIPDSELPVNPFLPMISVSIPSGRFRFQSIDVADSPSQALFGEGGQFNLGHVQPGAMLRGMMKFEFLPDTAGLGWLKRFIQGRDIVSIQVVAYKDNLVRIGKILVHKLLDFLRPVRLAAMLSDGDSSPALMGCREHETAASTVADVFVVNLFRMVFIGRWIVSRES